MSEKKEKPDWDERYRQDELPWDTGRPDTYLVRMVSRWPLHRGNVLDIGCGTGTNSLWLAGQGFAVTGLDISKEAIAIARKRAAEEGVDCCFVCDDFLTSTISGGSVGFVFDRGCFHSVQGKQRNLFVERVAELLDSGGLWLSLIGNADDPVQDKGPPKLSARAITEAMEPVFEILHLESCMLESRLGSPPRFWQCLLRKR